MVFQSLGDMAMILAPDHRILEVNAAMCKTTGLPREKLIGNYCYEFCHGTTAPPEQCPHDALLRSKEPTAIDMEMEVFNRKYLVTVAPILDDEGRVTKTVHIAKDITDRLGREELHTHILSASTEAFFMSNQEGSFLDVNESTCRLTGYNRAELLRMSILDLDAELTEKTLSKLLRHITREGNALFETHFHTKRNEVRNVELSITYSPVSGGVFFAFARDVTDRNIMESSLRESEELYRETLNSIAEAVFLTTNKGAFVYVCPDVDRLFGYSLVETWSLGNIQNLLGKGLFDAAVLDEVGEIANIERTVRDKAGGKHRLLITVKKVAIRGGTVLYTCRDVTDLRRRDEEIARRESEWVNTMDFIEDGIYLIDLDDRIVRANKAFYRLTGLTPEETLGRDVTSVLHPTGEPFPCPICQARLDRRDAFITMEADHPDNCTGRPIRVMVKIVRDDRGQPVSVVMGIRDLSQWMALKNREEQFRLLVETTPYGIEEVSTEGMITFANPALHQIFGYPPGAMIGKYIWHAKATPEGVLQLKAYFAHLVQDRPTPTPYFCTDRALDGRMVDLQVDWNYKFDPMGRLTGFISVVTDITEKVQLEDRLRHSQKMEAIGTLAGGIAHDFNNILAPIFGYTELAMSDVPPGTPVHEYLNEVFTAAKRAKDLVQQILTFSRKTAQEKRPVQIQPLVMEALRLLRATLPATIEIRQDIDPCAGPVLCDPTQIHQVMINLCTNAYHAMQDTGGLLTVRLSRLEIGPETDPANNRHDLPLGRHVCLSVEDTGTGIDKELLSRIFEPYFTTKKIGKGSGLGLAVVHGIVMTHGGQIHVESTVGKGSTFYVYLPEGQKKREDMPASETREVPERGNESILLVDDEPQILDIMTRILENLGYKVSAYADSQKALDAFRESPGAFDLVITDQAMPKLPGTELAKRLLNLRPDIPVILCTGYLAGISEESAQGIGIKRFMPKPIQRNELAKTVREVLNAP